MGKAVNPFSNLPDETCEHILDFLDGKTLVAVQQTCRRFRGIIAEDYSYRVFKPLIDRLPYQRRLEAYEKLLEKVSKREKAGVEKELQWLENLELIFWEKPETQKQLQEQEQDKNSMKTLLKGGTLKKATRNQTCCEAYFTICNVHDFIGDLAVSGVRFGEREKVLLRELVFRCAQLEEEDNTLLSIDTLVICMSYESTPEELRSFFKSLVVEVASMSPRWKKKAVYRVQHQLAYSGIQSEEEMKDILRMALQEIQGLK